MLRNVRGYQKDSSKSLAFAAHRRKSNLIDPVGPETFDLTLKAISSFVPTTLLKNLMEEGSAMRPHSSTMHGICLLADISGFTRLSGAFCARGKDGLDGLQSATSGYMGSLVNTIYTYGGDVIKFAGDALVCIFEPADISDEAFRRSCALALQCAWVLKEISTPELTLHVGISCGDICFGQLGGFENKWECLISGNCISQLSQCLDDAPSKNVAITAQCYKYLTDTPESEGVNFEADELKSGNYLISSVSVLSSCVKTLTEMRQATDDTLFLSQTACYVPRPVTQALMAGSFDFLAELREVTTVFIKLDGYDDNVHKDLLSLQKFFYACQEILSDSGGFLRQFLVDDKGCVLIALWGVPTATFHDDCRRALGATVRIRSKLLDMKMPCSSGITTGVVYCGTVGNEMRREYAAVGDVVNLAARLMSKAAGEILMDENTYSRLPVDVHRKLKKQAAMAVKGKDKPITTYKFDSTHTVQEDGRLGASLVNSSLDEELPIRQICKDAFMSPLNSLLSDAPAKDLQFLVLEGRLGTGREGSVSWLHRWCNTRGLRVASVRLKKADSSVDYRAVAKIFRHMIRDENFDDNERQTFVINRLLKQMYPKDTETRERVAYPTMRHALAVTCPLTTNRKGSSKPSLQTNTEEESSDKSRNSSKNDNQTPVTDKFEAKIPSSLMLTSVKDIFTQLFTEQPTVVIIEDAHEMDEASWKIILSLMKTQMKAFIVLTQEPISYLMSLFNAAGSETTIGELINPEAILAYDWIDGYVNRLTDNKKSNYVLLPELTFSEVRAHIAGTLKVAVKDLPEGLDQMTFDLSGGNPFWVDEISTFLTTYGVQEFISSLEIKGEGYIKNNLVACVKGAGRRSNPASRRSGSFVSEEEGGTKTPPEALVSPGSQGKMVRGSSSKLFNLLGTIKSGSKLEFLVVCRFAKLSMDEQSTARTASIIGASFTADVLSNSLPMQLGAYMPAILQSLIENHWLKSKSEVNSAGIIQVEYSFTHPLMHKTLYDLTPSSVKRTIHLSIAKYIERMCAGDKTFFMSLGYHYCRSEDTKKTYEYLTRAAFEMIISERGCMDESVILIQTASANISSDTDAIALLGVVCKGIMRLREKPSRYDLEGVQALGRFKKGSVVPMPAPCKFSASEVLAKKARFFELLDAIDEIRTLFREGRDNFDQKEESPSPKDKTREKEKTKKETNRGSTLSELSKKIMLGQGSARSVTGTISRVLSAHSFRDHETLTHSISHDEVDDADNKLKNALKSGKDLSSPGAEGWQIPLIAIRESYLLNAETDHVTRRISISNLMNALVEPPKSARTASQAKQPSSTCTIN